MLLFGAPTLEQPIFKWAPLQPELIWFAMQKREEGDRPMDGQRNLKKNIIRWLALIFLIISLLAGCNDNSNDGHDRTSCYSVEGTWETVEHVVGCGKDFTENKNYTLSQNECRLTVDVDGYTFSGSIDHDRITWQGSYPEDDGTTTITALSLAVSGDTISGSSTWHWTDGVDECSGSTTIAGELRSEGVPAPQAPASLAASATSSTTMMLSWSDNSVDETGFSIERSQTSATSGFSQIASTAANVRSYNDTGLTALTTYWYRIRAFNSGGDSNYSNVVSAATQAPSAGVPSPPLDLAATAWSSSGIRLTWTDASDDEDGFHIERSSGSCTAFTLLSTVGAGVQGYSDAGLSPSHTYCYRVRAYNGAGPSAYSNAYQTSTPPLSIHTLTVNKTGTGAGTVTAGGISCGADCSGDYDEGTQVQLQAQAGGGSTFIEWSGCDTADGTSCTVSMHSERMVTAKFNATISTAISLAPLTSPDTDGDYTLSWTVSGLASTAWSVQESKDSSFATHTNYTSYATSSPFTYSFADKPDGFYCYRIGLAPGGPFSNTRCVTVQGPTAAALRIRNNTHYDMIDIRLNGTQQVGYPNSIPAGDSADFTFNSGGTVSYDFGVGFYNTDGTRNIWFQGTGTTSVTAGNVTTVTCNNPTIGQLLSGFSDYRDWQGSYYCYTCPTLLHYARFRFTDAGGWTFYDDGVPQTTGSVSLVAWPDYASVVQFKICPTCDVISLYYPFGVFNYENGPDDWPIIEYVAQ